MEYNSSDIKMLERFYKDMDGSFFSNQSTYSRDWIKNNLEKIKKDAKHVPAAQTLLTNLQTNEDYIDMLKKSGLVSPGGIEPPLKD